MSCRVGVLGVLMLLVGALASPANGASIDVDGKVTRVRAEPTRMTWSTELCRGGGCDERNKTTLFRVWRSGLTGKRVKNIARIGTDAYSGGRLGSYGFADYDAAGETLTIRTGEPSSSNGDGRSSKFTFYSGLTGGTFDCDAAGDYDADLGPYSVDGGRTLYADSCSGKHTTRLYLRSEPFGATQLIAETPSLIQEVRLRGHYASWIEAFPGSGATSGSDRPVVRVRAVDASAPGYDVVGPKGRGAVNLSLAPDGRVAFLGPAPTVGAPTCGRPLLTASPARPDPVALATDACRHPTAITSNGVVYAGDAGDRRLAIRSVLGNGERHDLAYAPDGHGLQALDATAKRLVFAVANCGAGARLFSLPLGRSPVDVGDDYCPARRLPSRIKAVGRYASVSLTCPRGCRGFLWLVRNRRSLLGTHGFRSNGTHIKLSLYLRRALARRLRCGARIGATLRVSTFGRSAQSYDRGSISRTKRVMLYRPGGRSAHCRR